MFLALVCTSCQYLLPVEEAVIEVVKDVVLVEEALEKIQ
jgi:predicted DNA-binding protein